MDVAVIYCMLKNTSAKLIVRTLDYIKQSGCKYSETNLFESL